MTIELNREAIAQVTALPTVTEAAEAGSALISLWPLTEAMQMDNDAKYAENLQVRVTRAFARVLTGEDVTVPDAEFVYEGADEIPGRPQNIVDTLLAANDAYDTMADYSESGDVQLIFDAAEALDVRWDTDVAAQVRETIAAVEAQIEDDAAQGRLSTSSEPADVATRFATALAVCDALLSVVTGDGEHDGDAAAQAVKVLPILLYVNELREQFSVPRIFMTYPQLLELLSLRKTAHMIDDSGATATIGNSLGTLGVTAQFVGMLAAQEWAYHRCEILWDPEEAKRKAKEEDEQKSKEALAEKFKHVKDDPDKPQIDL